jgi:hypothetical protein
MRTTRRPTATEQRGKTGRRNSPSVIRRIIDDEAAKASGQGQNGQPATREEPAISAAPPDREQIVRLLAYYKWMDAGRPASDGVEFWLEAEREYLAQNGQTRRDGVTGPFAA